MTDYATTVRRHRRLAILRHLARSDGWTSNGAILLDMLNGVGVNTTWAQLRTELGYLHEIGLATVEEHDGFLVATVTERGLEIAEGRASHPEVARPRPPLAGV